MEKRHQTLKSTCVEKIELSQIHFVLDKAEFVFERSTNLGINDLF